MFKFLQLSYNEFVDIISSKKWSLSWNIIHHDYIDGCEKILDSCNNLIGLIYYDISSNPHTIAKFEVLQEFRNNGIGEMIIKEFLALHCCDFELIPLGEDAERFWKKCGFVGDHHTLYYEF